MRLLWKLTLNAPFMPFVTYIVFLPVQISFRHVKTNNEHKFCTEIMEDWVYS